MHAAIYCRKSTSQAAVDDDQKSVVRQEENARAFAAAHGWRVEDMHVYRDDAVSGAETRRLLARQRLLDRVASGRPPFQVLIMRDASRFSRRDGDEAFGELKRLAQAGVEIWFYQDGGRFTFGTFGDNVVGFVRAEMNAEYRRQIARFTTEAMIRKAQAGHVCGGRLFGYDNLRVDGHVERRINEAEAAVVREIFRRSAAGEGLRSIAKALNAAGAPSPRAQQGRSCSWAPSSVREVLHRDSYHGVVTWNRTKKRDADGQQCQQDRPASEWVTVQAEPLRLVSDALWQAVHDRLRQKHTARALGAPPLKTGRGIRQRHFLAGFGRCVQCGSAMMAVSRASGTGRQFRYCCAGYWNRGTTVCRNNMMADMAIADGAIGELLRAEVLQPRIVGRALDLAVAIVNRERDNGSDVARLQHQLAGIDRELANLAETAARGGAVPAVLALLARKDADRRQVAADMARLQARAPRLRASDLRQQLTGFLDGWHDLLASNTLEARAVLDSVLADRIRFEPAAERQSYRLTVPIAFDRVLLAAVPALSGFARNDGVPNSDWSFLDPQDYVVEVAAA